MLTGKERHMAFVNNMRNSVREYEEKKGKANTETLVEEYDTLREELERKFDELFGPIDDDN